MFLQCCLSKALDHSRRKKPLGPRRDRRSESDLLVQFRIAFQKRYDVLSAERTETQYPLFSVNSSV
jgi:hypothetical protein